MYKISPLMEWSIISDGLIKGIYNLSNNIFQPNIISTGRMD